MPKGSNVRKGERIGGRQKNTPNKRTTEALERERIAEQAKNEVDKAARQHIKLGKDILEDYVKAFAAIAAVYQNRVATKFAAGGEPTQAELDAFEKWGSLVAQHAKALADFQSPKFKAIAVVAPPPSPERPAPSASNVREINDQHAMARVYQQMIQKTA